jgi:hypothetical protein
VLRARPRGRTPTGLTLDRSPQSGLWPHRCIAAHPSNADAFFLSGLSSDGVRFTVAADEAGLRMLRVGIPSTTTFASTLTDLGLAVFSAVDFSSVLTLSNLSVAFFPSVAGNKCEPPLRHGSWVPALVFSLLLTLSGHCTHRLDSHPPPPQHPAPAAFVDTDGIEREPGLEIELTAAVPPLSIPDTRAKIAVASASGTAVSKLTVTVRPLGIIATCPLAR